MVKQVESWQTPNSYEQEQELQNQSPENGQLVKVEPRSSKKTSSIPSQLYYRLGLTMPRWLFWIFTVVIGITLSGLLVSSLALWTPLWSGIEKNENDIVGSLIDADDAP
ncbi:MAG: LytR family transcriptional regulator, partial [Cyanobacteria bacterium J06632_19]